MAKQKKPMPLWARLSVLVVVVVTCFLCFAILQGDSMTSTTTTQSTMTSTQENDYVIVDNGTIRAEFLGFEDHSDLGMFIVSIRVTNNIDKPIWVHLDSASVNNDMMQMVMSGVPLYIDPHKRGSNGFIFYYKQISIDSFDEIETVSFKLKVSNKDTMNEIWTSPEITIKK